jgi:hypothetical protein
VCGRGPVKVILRADQPDRAVLVPVVGQGERHAPHTAVGGGGATGYGADDDDVGAGDDLPRGVDGGVEVLGHHPDQERVLQAAALEEHRLHGADLDGVVGDVLRGGVDDLAVVAEPGAGDEEAGLAAGVDRGGGHDVPDPAEPDVVVVVVDPADQGSTEGAHVRAARAAVDVHALDKDVRGGGLGGLQRGGVVADEHDAHALGGGGGVFLVEVGGFDVADDDVREVQPGRRVAVGLHVAEDHAALAGGVAGVDLQAFDADLLEGVVVGDLVQVEEPGGIGRQDDFGVGRADDVDPAARAAVVAG